MGGDFPWGIPYKDGLLARKFQTPAQKAPKKCFMGMTIKDDSNLT